MSCLCRFGITSTLLGCKITKSILSPIKYCSGWISLYFWPFGVNVHLLVVWVHWLLNFHQCWSCHMPLESYWTQLEEYQKVQNRDLECTPGSVHSSKNMWDVINFVISTHFPLYSEKILHLPAIRNCNAASSTVLVWSRRACCCLELTVLDASPMLAFARGSM